MSKNILFKYQLTFLKWFLWMNKQKQTLQIYMHFSLTGKQCAHGVLLWLATESRLSFCVVCHASSTNFFTSVCSLVLSLIRHLAYHWNRYIVIKISTIYRYIEKSMTISFRLSFSLKTAYNAHSMYIYAYVCFIYLLSFYII